MERSARLIASVFIAVAIAAIVVACGERRPCNAPVKSLDAADSTAPAQ